MKARQSLEDDSSKDDRAALECLIEAVAALDDEVQGLSDGSRPFKGPVYVPNGWIMAKPSTGEAD